MNKEINNKMENININIDTQKSLFKKFITWTVLIFMPLSTYVTPISGITFGDVLLIVAFISMILSVLVNNHNLVQLLSLPLVLYGFFVVIHSLLLWLLDPTGLTMGILGVLRHVLYIMVGGIGAKYFFNYEYGYRIYKILAIVFSIYCIVQYFSFKLFSVILPPNLFGLPSVDYITNVTSENNLSMYLSGIITFRPRSVFLEPSYYAAYQIPILYLVLHNNKEKTKSKYLVSAIITISIFLAGTSTGIILLIFCWWKTIIKELKKLSPKFIGLMILSIPVVLYFFNSLYIQKIIRRIISSDGGLGTSVIGRIGNYTFLFSDSFNWFEIIIGCGIWKSIGYLPSYGSILLYYGILGFFIYMLLMFWSFVNCGKRGRAMIILMMILFIGTNTLFNITSVLMFFLIYSNYGNKKSIQNNNLMKA